jgi:nitrate reductase assembly molybdenum cofactor insertion protein NarJ
MNTNILIRRAQVYSFLADAFLYPRENWLEDLPALEPVLQDLELVDLQPSPVGLELCDLQMEHRRVFGLTGSMCYETEIGLPHEFRQSQEMADIAGFYRAFGFTTGGPVHERPDHIAVELEFMHILALKEAYAVENGKAEHAGVSLEAQRSFLQEHLGSWTGLFAQALEKTTGEGVYAGLARFAAAFILADAGRLGITLEQRPLAALRPTPPPQDISCESCPVAS